MLASYVQKTFVQYHSLKKHLLIVNIEPGDLLLVRKHN